MITITSQSSDRSLLTLGELRSAVGATGSAQDAKLQMLGNYVAAAITKACGVSSAAAAVPTLRLESLRETVRLDSRQNYLSLSRWPVVELTSVTENDVAVETGGYEADGRMLYRISGDTRICWPCGQIVVEYSAGYEIVPDDLKFAAIKFVQAEWAQGGRDPLLRSESIPDVISREYWVDPTKESVIPAEVMDLLERGGYVEKWAWMR